MILQKLPLELVQAILAEAMLARGLRRALRLRLVNKLFASEVLKMLGELRMLDNVKVRITAMGSIGASYISHRLLSKRSPSGPHLTNMRRIAARFAREDGEPDDADAYKRYITSLSSLIASHYSCHMLTIFTSDEYAEQSGALDCEFLAAAVFMDKLSIVEELSEDEKLLRTDTITIPSLYAAAASTGNIIMIDLLLQRAHCHGKGVGGVWYDMLEIASETGSLETVEHLLTSRFNPGFYGRKDGYLETFHRALYTPNVNVFEILMQYKEAKVVETLAPIEKAQMYKTVLEDWLQPLSEERLARLLRNAVVKGWEKMAVHLLDMGVPTEGYYVFGQGRDDSMPLFLACVFGSEGTVRVLLERHAPITGLEIQAAAAKGRVGIVKLLLEHGANCNGGKIPPIVSAIVLEHKEMFHLLLEHGATLEGAGRTAAIEARKAGLDSMLALLEQYSQNRVRRGWKY